MIPSLETVAIVVNTNDHVAVAKTQIAAGTELGFGGRTLHVSGNISPGHRFAIRDIPAGEWVRQYNQPFGRSKGISAGDAISNANLLSEIPRFNPGSIEIGKASLQYAAPEKIPTFQGYRRSNGQVGSRNWVLILPTSMCSSHESFMISMIAEQTLWSPEKFPNVTGVTACPHTRGCGCPDGASVGNTMKILLDFMNHPNVGAVLVIELGCEKTNLNIFENFARKHGNGTKPIRSISVQELGGTQATIQAGLKLIPELLQEANQCARQPVPVSELILGTKCGGSDAFSGISANPALGFASDLLLQYRGTSLITEVPEFYGAEHLFAERARSREAANQVFEAMERYRKYMERNRETEHSMAENPSPGNKEGGLINITIKSLGALAKSGTAPVEGVVDYGQVVDQKGLFLVYCPSYDQESTPALVASGAQLVCFTTGRGTGIGNAIAPVLKISSNTRIYDHMKGDIDFNAGTIIDGQETIEETGRKLFQKIISVASGELTAAERNKHREFAIWIEENTSL